jgi:hypothetical protein
LNTSKNRVEFFGQVDFHFGVGPPGNLDDNVEDFGLTSFRLVGDVVLGGDAVSVSVGVLEEKPKVLVEQRTSLFS